MALIWFENAWMAMQQRMTDLSIVCVGLGVSW
jgi:hypothetical protein